VLITLSTLSANRCLGGNISDAEVHQRPPISSIRKLNPLLSSLASCQRSYHQMWFMGLKLPQATL